MTLPKLLGPLAERPDRAAVLLDFDGSISAIVDDPTAAQVLPGARAALARLLPLIARVGVVSGRPVEVLDRAVDLPGLILIGQYGLERLERGRVVVDARAKPYLPAVMAAADDAERELPGLLIERKGELAVTVHWRTAPERDAEAVAAVDRIATRHGLAVHPTRMAREIRPPLPVDKGTAIETVLDGVAAVCFAGDDRGDVPAFDALQRLVADGRIEHAARIAVRSPEVPSELLERADLVVDGPTGLVALLEQLIAAAAAAAG